MCLLGLEYHRRATAPAVCLTACAMGTPCAFMAVAHEDPAASAYARRSGRQLQCLYLRLNRSPLLTMKRSSFWNETVKLPTSMSATRCSARSISSFIFGDFLFSN